MKISSKIKVWAKIKDRIKKELKLLSESADAFLDYNHPKKKLK